MKKKKKIIGIGNYFYPQSRHSIGFFILDKLVELKQLNWTFYQNERFWATEFENFILLKPQTYLIEDNRFFFSFIKVCLLFFKNQLNRIKKTYFNSTSKI